MRINTFRNLAAFAVAGFLLVSSPLVPAQAPGMPGGGVGYNALVAKIFNDIPSFSANVETSLTNTVDKSRIIIPMRMLKRDEKLRIEVDFTRMKGVGLSMQGLAAMQNIGMARMASLVSPSDRVMLVLFPDLKFQTKVELSESDVPNAGYKVARKSLGKETVNGQACVRQLITITSSDGKKNEATTWESTALNNFPLRILMKPEGNTMTMTFSDVSLTSPPEEELKVPADYKSFDGIASLMQEAATRAFKAPK